MTEGPLWPDLLATYEPISEEDDLLLLRRRAKPLQSLLRGGPSQTVGFDEAVAIPNGSGPQFLSVRIGRTVLGTLVDILLRPPIINMKVVFFDGDEQIFRIVRAIGEGGFLVTPFSQGSYHRPR